MLLRISHDSRTWGFLFAVATLVLAYLSLVKAPTIKIGPDTHNWVVHFIAYLIYGAVAGIWRLTAKPGIRNVRLFGEASLPTTIYGVLLEGLQFYLPNRDFDPVDGLCNIMGALVGAAIISFRVRKQNLDSPIPNTRSNVMKLNSIHFLLSYACTYECDHCFLYSSSGATGTFTVGDLDTAFEQISQCPRITSICFEGGEPFLYYPVLLYGARKAKKMELEVDIVTNCFWALDRDTARVSLEPFAEIGLDNLSVSEDRFHCGDAVDEATELDPLPRFAREVSEQLGINKITIAIDEPVVTISTEGEHTPGEPIVGGGVRFRGRAADKLTEGLPGKPAGRFTECPDEDLDNPGRLHLDVNGNLQICQGVIVGNINQVPLKEFISTYTPDANPILKLLKEGGPYRLALEAGLVEGPEDGEYVDACHLCYIARKKLMVKYPELLGPPGVYGEKWD